MFFFEFYGMIMHNQLKFQVCVMRVFCALVCAIFEPRSRAGNAAAKVRTKGRALVDSPA